MGSSTESSNESSNAIVLHNNLLSKSHSDAQSSLQLRTYAPAKKVDIVVEAIAYVACKGNKACIEKKIKAAKCQIGKFSVKNVKDIAIKYSNAAKKKDIKGMRAASDAFKKAMAPIVKCNITPSNMRAAFKRGFKIGGGKKKVKKAKKAVKKVKKAKKGKKKAKKAKKKAKKAHKKAKKAKKSAKKAKSPIKCIKHVKKAKKAMKKKMVKKGKKAAK